MYCIASVSSQSSVESAAERRNAAGYWRARRSACWHARPVEHVVLQLLDRLQMAGIVEPAVGGFDEPNQITFDADALDAVEIAEVEHGVGEHPVQRTAIAAPRRAPPAGRRRHELPRRSRIRSPAAGYLHRRQKLARQPAIRRQHTKLSGSG